ncbi:sigma-70 family RNA polymerase sigma factor [Segetibacter sp. 3557_3]|uniref:RNA polymerase sigma factor n=1 Tax=Segetibacter sp. 3557_3 TaxID=2547429 RepID=UPI001058A9ED|nr:sigma-70 family RNA polymerase sigma factor [Segetibacter sp. 3557_3]TDH28069.1 sigma-70 family RNA polymerase sigma factor [Segetibacter sp. 3557_3]
MNEFEIIRGCLKHDVNCQRKLFEHYAGKMMTVCLRYAKDSMEAEDLLQESFIKVFRYIHQFKFEGSFEGWIRRIVVNNALKSVKKKKINFQEINDRTHVAEHLEPFAYSNLGEEDLMKLINQLPEGYRLVFNLSVIEGFTHEEIATMLNIQPGTSRSQLVKARKMLQNQVFELQKIAV